MQCIGRGGSRRGATCGQDGEALLASAATAMTSTPARKEHTMRCVREAGASSASWRSASACKGAPPVRHSHSPHDNCEIIDASGVHAGNNELLTGLRAVT